MRYVVAVVALLLVLTAPTPPVIPPRGDEALAAKVTPHIHENRMIAMMAVDREVSFALIESSLTTPYRVDALTELFTIELLYNAVRRGEVTGSTKLGSLLDVRDTPAADVTLRELADHRGGFAPRLDTKVPKYQELIHHAKFDPLDGRGQRQPSAVGIALLGHALAVAAGTDYATLLRTRLLRPMELNNTRISNEFDALAPATGSISTVQDIARFARYVMTAKEWDDHEWVRSGSQPDFQSALAVHPNRRAVVVLSRGDIPVEEAALEALHND